MRKGRNVEILNETLQVKEKSKDQSKILDSQRRSMIEAIDSYEGDDPLHPWLQCIRWVKDAYPSGGHQSELLQVVEACTRTFQDDERYKSDIRYLRVWVIYADLCKEPQEIYEFLEARSIGQDHALFYEAYATYKELCKSYTKANEIFELGLRRGAKPTTRLQLMYQSFLKRMMQRNERKLQEDQNDVFEPEKLRHFGDSKSSQSRSSARNPSFVQDQQRRKVQQPQVQRSGMEVFVDDEFHSGTRSSSVPQPSSMRAPVSTTWKNLGTQKEVKKENDQQPARWTETKVPRIGKVPKHVEAHPPIQVFVDDECEEAHARIKAKNASLPTTTLRQRVDGAYDLRRDQEALQKNPLLNFTESEKPSTASLLRREPGITVREQEGSESGDVTTSSLSGAAQLVGSEIYHEREDGHESSFEEARLSRWKIPHDAVNGNAVLSPRSSAERAMLIEKSLNMFQSKSGRQNSEEQSPLSDKEPADKSSMSRVSSLSSMDEPPAFFCTMPSSQISVNGEETVAIKKYAEELITHGADPNAQADIGGHQGLIDQTINTKECLSDILSMFNRPLACEKPQRKVRASTTTSRPPNSFEVFVDDFDDAPQPQKNSKDRAAFEIFNDDENEPKQLPSGMKGFEVFVDEEGSAPPPVRITKPASKKPFQILHDEEFAPRPPAKKSFEVFTDEDIVEVQTDRNRIARPPARKPAPALSRGSFEILPDEDVDVKAKTGHGLKIFEDTQFSKPSKGSTSKAAFEVYADDECDAMPAPRNVDRRIPKNKPVSKTQNSGFSIFVDDDVASSQQVRKPKLASSTRR